MDKKLTILVCFFSVLTLISSIITTSLVFYNENARTEVNSNKVLASNKIYKSVNLTYNQDNTFNIISLTPGSTVEKSFSITNNNSDTINYRIEWQNVTSTWGISTNGLEIHPEEFIYSITCSNGESLKQKRMPTDNKDNIILKDLELPTNVTNDCTIKVLFVNKGTDQSYNSSKAFKGTYKVIIEE